MNTQERPRPEFYTRQGIKDAALVVFSVLVLYACWILLQPFLAPIAWAMAIAVVARPMRNKLEANFKPTTSALLGTLIVLILLIGPVAFVTQQILSETRGALPRIVEALRSPAWLSADGQPAWLQHAIEWFQTRFDLDTELQRLSGRMTGWTSAFLGGSVWALTQWVVMILTLFYFLRDHSRILRFLEEIVPLNNEEAGTLFTRISQAINATIYGNLLVKMFQGALTGFMFWALGLPMPVLFGAAAALAALLPMVGTAFVWGPAVFWFFVQGMWIKGIIMTLWGAVLVSLIDNFMYPLMVASELKVHPLGVFFSVFGGMIVFGLVGMILGPVILAITLALWEVWRMRLENSPEEIS